MLLLMVGLAIAARVAVGVAQSRAQVLADAAAHATAGYLAADDRRDAFSRELQMGFICQLGKGKKETSLTDSGGGGDAGDATSLCAASLATARDLLRRNDPAASIAFFAVAPDVRDYTDAGGATRLVVWIAIDATGPMANVSRVCGHSTPGGSLCEVEAASAARESG
jgi:hypothetical protein